MCYKTRDLSTYVCISSDMRKTIHYLLMDRMYGPTTCSIMSFSGLSINNPVYRSSDKNLFWKNDEPHALYRTSSWWDNL